MNITTLLDQYVRSRHLGTVCAAETGFRLATEPDLVRAPDGAFIARERVEAVGDVEGYWPGAPDLVIEVISPGGADPERTGGAGSAGVAVWNARRAGTCPF